MIVNYGLIFTGKITLNIISVGNNIISTYNIYIIASKRAV